MTGIEQILAAFKAAMREVVREEIAALKPKGGLVTIAAYAAARAISPATVRAAIKSGRLSVVKNGRAWRVRSDEEISAPPTKEDESARVLRLIGGSK